MDFLVGFQKPRPVFNLQLLLSQDKLQLSVCMVDFAIFWFDLGEQIERDVVFYPFGCGAGERHVGGADLDIRRGLGHIGRLDIDIEIIAGGVSARRALSPCD